MKAYPFNGKTITRRREIRQGFSAIAAGQLAECLRVSVAKTWLEKSRKQVVP